MVKYIIYIFGIAMVVGIGLWFELNSGDYLLIEKRRMASEKSASAK